MTELQAAQSVKNAATLLVANLEAIATFASLPGDLKPSPVYEKERKKSLKALLAGLKSLKEVVSAKKGKTSKRKVSSELTAWRKEGMSLLGKAVAAEKRQDKDAASLRAAYEKWKSANPAPGKKTASTPKEKSATK